MTLFKFFIGIVLSEAATYLLLVLVPGELNFAGFLRVAVALLFIALILALWFTSIARDQRRDTLSKASARAHVKANFKVGVAFAGMLGIGALFLFAQMMTAGLLAISATVGAMGGYYWRGKRLESLQSKEIEASIDSKHLETKDEEK